MSTLDTRAGSRSEGAPAGIAANRTRATARWVAFVGLLVLLGSLLAHLSLTIHPRFLNFADSVDSQKAILERRPFVFGGESVDYVSWRSRVLVPYAIAGLSRATGLRFSQSYLAVHWLTAIAALGAFALLAARQVRRDWRFAGIAASLLTVVLLPTFLHIYEIPSDFADAGFFALLTLLALERRRGWFVLVLLIALANRESAIFSLLIWFCGHDRPLWSRASITEGVFCAIVAAVGMGLVFWLRLHFAVVTNAPVAEAVKQPVMPSSVPLSQLRDFLRHPYWGGALFFLFGYLVFFTAVLTAGWRELPVRFRRSALAAAVIFGLSIPFANLPELRVYIPSLVLVTLAVVALLPRSLEAAPAPRL